LIAGERYIVLSNGSLCRMLGTRADRPQESTVSHATFDSTVITLMQGDVARLGDDPAHALRLVLRLAGGLDAFHARMRRDLNLHATEYAALLALWDGGRCSLSQLSSKVELSRAAMTALVDRLEGLGYVQRVPSPIDRRVVLLALAPSFEDALVARAAGFQDALTTIAAGDPAAWGAFAEGASAVRLAAHAAADAERASDDATELAPRRRPRQPRRFVPERERVTPPPAW